MAPGKQLGVSQPSVNQPQPHRVRRRRHLATASHAVVAKRELNAERPGAAVGAIAGAASKAEAQQIPARVSPVPARNPSIPRLAPDDVMWPSPKLALANSPRASRWSDRSRPRAIVVSERLPEYGPSGICPPTSSPAVAITPRVARSPIAAGTESPADIVALPVVVLSRWRTLDVPPGIRVCSQWHLCPASGGGKQHERACSKAPRPMSRSQRHGSVTSVPVGRGQPITPLDALVHSAPLIYNAYPQTCPAAAPNPAQSRRIPTARPPHDPAIRGTAFLRVLGCDARPLARRASHRRAQ